MEQFTSNSKRSEKISQKDFAELNNKFSLMNDLSNDDSSKLNLNEDNANFNFSKNLNDMVDSFEVSENNQKEFQHAENLLEEVKD